MNESVKDSVQAMQGFVEKCANGRLSGTVVFTLHFRNGGVGRTQVETKEDLRSNNGQKPDDGRVRNG
jgi:hypothetical protein